MTSSSNSIIEYKNQFEKFVSESVDILESFQNISLDSIDNEKLKESIENISKIILSGISNIKKDLDFIKKNVECDKFNIAFFGETNAGKSTLIEALIRGDGRTIGDGSKDFTKKLESRKINNLNLLDMPGIEGNEKKFINRIRMAIQKSHIVFYVIGTNKEPEDETLKKIKSYLKDQAKVYSILNIRGKPSAYKYKRLLLDENANIIESRTKQKFLQILGQHYVDNIILNAYLGFLSVGKPKREDLIEDKNKVLDVFNSYEDAFDFSRLNYLENFISTLAKFSSIEIVVSNSYKILKSLEVIISKIISEKKNFDSELKKIKRQIEELSEKSKRIIEKYQIETTDLINMEINTMKIKMQKIVSEGIENEWPENYIKREISEVRDKYKDKIRKDINAVTNNLKEELTNALDEFKNRVQYELKFNAKSDININAIIKKLEISFGYVFNQILDVGLSVWVAIGTFAINPILGIVVSVLAVFRKIWEWFLGDPEKRKNEAKAKAYMEIENSTEQLKRSIQYKISKRNRKLNSDVEIRIKEINLSFEHIQKTSYYLTEKIKRITKSKVDISILLVKHILDQQIDFAYIDLHLDKMIIIGNKVSIPDKKLFRVSDIFVYNSISELFYNVNCKLEKTTLKYYGNDEFISRVISEICHSQGLRFIKEVKNDK